MRAPWPPTTTDPCAARAYVEAERLAATNFELAEQGAEQAGRTEASGEATGAIRRDRLFYFVGCQAVDRTFSSPALASSVPGDFLCRARDASRPARPRQAHVAADGG